MGGKWGGGGGGGRGEREVRGGMERGEGDEGRGGGGRGKGGAGGGGLMSRTASGIHGAYVSRTSFWENFAQIVSLIACFFAV